MTGRDVILLILIDFALTSQDENGFVNRLYSFWLPPEQADPSPLVVPVMLFPETYSSRHWGRRRFVSCPSKEDAATHIAAVTRGFLVRQRLRKYYAKRYIKTLDEESGYYYFTDLHDEREEAETCWHKPRLAFPGDIDVYNDFREDPQKFMGQKKYTYVAVVLCCEGVSSFCVHNCHKNSTRQHLVFPICSVTPILAVSIYSCTGMTLSWRALICSANLALAEKHSALKPHILCTKTRKR